MTLSEMQTIAKTENVIFFKVGCPFCKAAQLLFDKLRETGIIDSYLIYNLDQDFSNADLTELVKSYGWEPDGYQEVCTKPQIFIQVEYVGGNYELYRSKWNRGLDGSGKLVVNGREIATPNQINPMKF